MPPLDRGHASGPATPIDLLFGGMSQLGPGSDADTDAVLDLLSCTPGGVVVDAGCGTGRQTLVLARRLRAPIHAVDIHQPFLDELVRRAESAGLGGLVQPHCYDIAAIPDRVPAIDLLWSEGAAYTIGFANALAVWRPAIRSTGWVVVSELTWLRADPPSAVRAYFAAAYPDMRSTAENRFRAEAAGYRVRGTHVLPAHAWTDGYYDVLEPRARELSSHPTLGIRQAADEMLEEIRIFREAEGSYGYVFFVLQPA